ncbi:LysR substrate-binding domain-containing protein [Sphingomonas sp.]|uniref:LysR substrate-binding domain-containing protein n=1 Tax=Sphingomonas sp. TaxID=28214 RepID=UPI0035C7CC33
MELGHNTSLSAGNSCAAMMDWRHADGGVDVKCVEADRNVLFAGLDMGEIDVAVLIGAANQNGFRCEPLWSERVLAALPATHLLAERDVVHWTDLRNEVIYLPLAGTGADLRDMLLDWLGVSGVSPDIQIHHCSRETILSILGRGWRRCDRRCGGGLPKDCHTSTFA